MKIKKLLLPIVLILCIISIGYYFLTFEEEPVNEELYKYASVCDLENDENSLICIIEDKDDSLNDLKIEDENYFLIGGSDKFAIIPKYDDMIFEIYEQKLNDNGEMDLKLIKKIKGLFHLECNQSDLYSNVLIKFNYKNKEYSYSPYYSLKDGSLHTEEFVKFKQ